MLAVSSNISIRQNQIDTVLVAVISLPGGVFNPYSGVKTSILILDKVLAPKTDYVAFFKVECDGYDLGAQRRPIGQDDLPAVTDEISEYLRRLRAGESLNDFEPQTGLLADRDWIADDGDYNLSGERYRENVQRNSQHSYVQLGEISEKPKYGSPASKAEFDGKVRYVRITDITDSGRLKSHDLVSPSEIDSQCFLEPNDLLIARSGSVGRTYLHEAMPMVHQYAGYLIRFRIDPFKALPKYVYQVTKSKAWEQWIVGNSKVGTINNINAKQYSSFAFPLPPLEVQRELVAEIEEYQRVVDGARAVVDNWRPRVDVDPEWPIVPLQEACDIQRGKFSHRPSITTTVPAAGGQGVTAEGSRRSCSRYQARSVALLADRPTAHTPAVLPGRPAPASSAVAAPSSTWSQ